MKNLILCFIMASSPFVFGKGLGPLPHERTDTSKLLNSTTGRYLYVGDVPKFNADELEITISKMSLTARVTGLVNQGRIDTYSHQLFMRWKSINDAFSDHTFSLHPLVKISQLAKDKPLATQAWSVIAEQYSSHILETTEPNIYLNQRNANTFLSYQAEEDYKELMSEAYFRLLFDTNESSSTVINDNKKLEDLLSVNNSRKLFHKHLGHLYTASDEKDGYRGYLTLVYPIAATVAGPFDQPKESIIDLKAAESMEARWWSNKWNDEFGGFPFLLIEWSGVAFHGPITNFSPLDVWFLRRGYVSHGCHRMDASDLLELRALMPIDLKKAGAIKVTILDYFDVLDWNKDGTYEAMDVKYYHIPSSISVPKGKTAIDVIRPYLVENQEKNFFKTNKYSAPFYDAENDVLRKVPQYEIGRRIIKRVGIHDSVGIYRFSHRPNRVLQYSEDGHKLMGFDDSFGKYPPKYFQRY